MTPPARSLAAGEVLARYPLGGACDLVPLGNRGGFSGAFLWQVRAAGSLLCLRAWPVDEPDLTRLRQIHRLMRVAREAGLEFVPAVFAARDGATAVEHAGRRWDLTTWMPGRADFHERPTAARLEAACTALARLHAAWAQVAPAVGPCPAVRRRLERAREWTALVAAGWRPVAGANDPVRPWCERAWRVLQVHAAAVPARLAPWADRPVSLQPCLCDVWHDHVLFEGDTVRGLVDYGAVKTEHVAIDLARLLGSLVGDDAAARAAGLNAYRRLRPLSADEEELVVRLDETGTLLGAANWLRWLYHDGRAFDDRATVARRLAALVERVERWRPPRLA